ncbi:hypothetical protein TPHA_0D00220 [Tetrapisispora phaffii CBS 4417]|uniref:VASt domain-containing protein n=1 Tax=Tetrapisispora phaffii (strain ATCC 24235 / CBS 4417 / NBRC 1672 / NRRL Y-8282 / UCD 70-5) TaxID=1071381 RepID=G8BS45_TETPH|nr:hypothetical protein TPHA_0D00220 [Tetrapisispora phaffii CBS 4417]CCE62666.1 hypothetical protein TPHA_0D00220 [Tetrapisispora phaffii CBS 4417]
MSRLLWNKYSANDNRLQDIKNASNSTIANSTSETVLKISTRPSYEESSGENSGNMSDVDEICSKGSRGTLQTKHSQHVLTTKRSLMRMGSDHISMKSLPADPHVSEINSLSENGATYSDDNEALKLVNGFVDKGSYQLDSKEKNDRQNKSLDFNPNNANDQNASNYSFLGNVMTSLAFGKGNHDMDQNYSLDKFSEKQHFASTTRDKIFHNLFQSIAEDERLIDTFENFKIIIDILGKKNVTYFGDLYISSHHLSFNSKSLNGLNFNFTLLFTDVLKIKLSGKSNIVVKTTNGDLLITSKNSKQKKTNLLIADLHTLLNDSHSSQSILYSGVNNTEHANRALSPTLLLTHNNKCPSGENLHNQRKISENNDELIQNAIRSVDDYSTSELNFTNDNDSDIEFDYDNVDAQVTGTEDSLCDLDNSNQSIYILKPDSKYSYNGPAIHSKTSGSSEKLHKNEYVLSETVLNSPPGLVFQLMFSDLNYNFWLEFGKVQSNTEFSGFGIYEDNIDEDGNTYREYKYTKALNYPIGPKSTTCFTRDTILRMDFTDHIDVLNTTTTPDVPSGDSFSMKTRYQFSWGDDNTCVLKISYWVDWTGSSWIKGMIDSSCKSGQISVNKEMIPFIQEYVRKHTIQSKSVPPKKKISIDNPTYKIKESSKIQKILEPSNNSKPVSTQTARNGEKSNSKKLEDKASNTHNYIIIILLCCVTLLCSIQTYQNYVIQKTVDELNESMRIITKIVLTYWSTE